MIKKNYGDIAALATGSAVEDQPRKNVDKKIKPKLVPLPLEWDEILEFRHHGTKSSYILAAIKEKMIRDGYL